MENKSLSSYRPTQCSRGCSTNSHVTDWLSQWVILFLQIFKTPKMLELESWNFERVVSPLHVSCVTWHFTQTYVSTKSFIQKYSVKFNCPGQEENINFPSVTLIYFYTHIYTYITPFFFIAPKKITN